MKRLFIKFSDAVQRLSRTLFTFYDSSSSVVHDGPANPFDVWQLRGANANLLPSSRTCLPYESSLLCVDLNFIFFDFRKVVRSENGASKIHSYDCRQSSRTLPNTMFNDFETRRGTIPAQSGMIDIPYPEQQQAI